MAKVNRNEPCPCGSGKKYKNCCIGKSKIKTQKMHGFSKKLSISIALILILLIGAAVRYYGFNRPHMLTFDEGIYSDLLPNKLMKDVTDYSTQSIYSAMKAAGRYTPAYLSKPLFKHPPLFPSMIALTYSLFGQDVRMAAGVSIFFGMLMVILSFFLGKLLYDDRVGLISALFLSLDPIHWLCSEKIWVETTLSFFIILSIVCFTLAKREKKFFILSGVCIGLGMLTKYPGILPLIIFFSFALLFERGLLKTMGFWLMNLVSFLVFLPWIIWNYKIYGNLFSGFIEPHAELIRFFNMLVKHKLIIAISVLAGTFLILLARSNFSKKLGEKIALTLRQKELTIAVCALISIGLLIHFPVTRKIVQDSLAWQHIFVVGWNNPFMHEPWYFYLKRMLEFSPVYFMSFFSLLILIFKNKNDLFLVWCSFVILLFYILWGNFQSRYILSVIPFLIILSARSLMWAYDTISLKEKSLAPGAFRIQLSILKFLVIAVALYFTIKAARVDMILGFHNNFAYF